MLIKFINSIKRCKKKDKDLTEKQLKKAKEMLLQQMLDERDINYNIFNKYTKLYNFSYTNIIQNSKIYKIYLNKIQKTEDT